VFLKLLVAVQVSTQNHTQHRERKKIWNLSCLVGKNGRLFIALSNLSVSDSCSYDQLWMVEFQVISFQI